MRAARPGYRRPMSGEGRFEQPDEAVIDVQELTALHCVQGKVHQRITPRGETIELARQLARRAGKSAGGNPDSVPLRGRPVSDDRRQVALMKPGKLRVTAHPERPCRRGHDRGRANDNPRCYKRKYLQRIGAPDVSIVDDDQPSLTGGQCPDRRARGNWIVLVQQPPRDLLIRAGVGEQLRPEQAPGLAADGCGGQNLEPATAGPVRGRPDQHGLAGSGRPGKDQDPARPGRCRFQEHIDLTEFGRPPHRLHMPESRASEPGAGPGPRVRPNSARGRTKCPGPGMERGRLLGAGALAYRVQEHRLAGALAYRVRERRGAMLTRRVPDRGGS